MINPIVREIRLKWKPRKATANKGDFGRVFILAGSKGLSGASRLAGMGALRSGAGLVTLGVPEAIYSIVARQEPELMVKPFPSTRQGSVSFRALHSLKNFLQNQNVFALGPGLSQNPETQKLIRSLIKAVNLPLVIDADALNAMKGHASLLKNVSGKAVLTPHPGEFQRVFGSKPSASEADRKKKAQAAAKKYGVIVVLKGNRTVVASPSGQVYVNSTGNPGMATAGMGDVLTGIIASFIGQKLSLWDAARFGVYLHGFAGDLAAKKIGKVGMTASDVIHLLPSAVRLIWK